MIPEKYRKEKKFNKSKNLLYTSVFSIVFFLAGYLVIGPLVHEIAHLVFLKLQGCDFYSRYSFSFLSGLTGTFELNCSLSQVSETVFFITGYFTTLVTGIFAFFISRQTDRFKKIFLSSGLGILVSIFSSLGMKGDLHSVPEFHGSLGLLLTLTMFLVVSIATVLALEPHISEWEERN